MIGGKVRSSKRRSPAKRSTKRSPAKRSTKRSPAKRSTKRRSTAKRSTKRSPAKRSNKRRSPAKRSTKRSTAKRSTKRSTAKRSTKRRSTAKRSNKRRSPAKRSTRRNQKGGNIKVTSKFVTELYTRWVESTGQINKLPDAGVGMMRYKDSGRYNFTNVFITLIEKNHKNLLEGLPKVVESYRYKLFDRNNKKNFDLFYEFSSLTVILAVIQLIGRNNLDSIQKAFNEMENKNFISRQLNKTLMINDVVNFDNSPEELYDIIKNVKKQETAPRAAQQPRQETARRAAPAPRAAQQPRQEAARRAAPAPRAAQQLRQEAARRAELYKKAAAARTAQQAKQKQEQTLDEQIKRQAKQREENWRREEEGRISSFQEKERRKMEGNIALEQRHDLYAYLGLKMNATARELKKAYVKNSLKYHPDKNPGNKKAEEIFKKVNEAWRILSDPVSKNEYDKDYKQVFKK
jgi:hypothetical protein